MIKVNFNFRERLNSIIEAEFHCYCFQCGACVGDCPAARFSDKFNPRLIMLKAITGQEEELIRPDSIIWECTNCYNCYERCPQDVRPVEVIMALKNICTECGYDPSIVRTTNDSIRNTGRTVTVTPQVNKRREELGLKPLSPVPMDEIKKLL